MKYLTWIAGLVATFTPCVSLADLKFSKEALLTKNDVSLLFPLEVRSILPHADNFLSPAQLDEVSLSMGSDSACISAIRVDPASPLRAFFGSGHGRQRNLSDAASDERDRLLELLQVKRQQIKHIQTEGTSGKNLTEAQSEHIEQLKLETDKIRTLLRQSLRKEIPGNVSRPQMIVTLPSLRLVLQSCSSPNLDLAVHVLYEFSKEDILDFASSVVKIRQKHELFFQEGDLTPLTMRIGAHQDYLQEFSAILAKWISQNQKIHRITSIKSVGFREWGFRAVDFSFDHGQEKNWPAQIPNIPYVSDLGTSFQQALLNPVGLENFLNGSAWSYLMTKTYIHSIITKGRSPDWEAVGKFISDPLSFPYVLDELRNLNYKNQPLLGFPLPLTSDGNPRPNTSDSVPKVVSRSILFDSPLRDSAGVYFGADPRRVNPSNTDCISCHTLPTLTTAKVQSARAIFNTGHFRYLDGQATISELTANETNTVFDELEPLVNERIRQWLKDQRE